MTEPPAGTARPRRIVLVTSFALLAALFGAGGMAVGNHVFLSFAYMVPIGLTAWVTGLVPALLLACACAFDWLLVGLDASPGMHGAIPIADAIVELGFYTVIAATLHALHRSLDHERALATTDDVTGVPNRRAFYERASLEIERLRRAGAPLTLVFLDLDEFKGVNDRFGHRAGDEVLRGTARTLRRSLRAVDFVARLGGDEFGLLLPSTNEEAARTVLVKVRDELRSTFAAEGWPVTSSAGAVTFSRAPSSIDAALAEADLLLYAVKGAGKNGVAHRSLDSGAHQRVAGGKDAAHTRA